MHYAKFLGIAVAAGDVGGSMKTPEDTGTTDGHPKVASFAHPARYIVQSVRVAESASPADDPAEKHRSRERSFWTRSLKLSTWLNIITASGAVVTSLTMIVLVFQLFELQRGNAHAYDATKLENRALVYQTDVNYQYGIDPKSKKIVGLNYWVTLRNAGRTSTNGAMEKIYTYFTDKKLVLDASGFPKDLPAQPGAPQGLDAEFQPIDIPPEQNDAVHMSAIPLSILYDVLNGKSNWYTWGEVQYNDVFGECHRMRFYLQTFVRYDPLRSSSKHPAFESGVPRGSPVFAPWDNNCTVSVPKSLS